ncbi:esterase/lipase family protein [Geosporobacter ferrireducens]|uniref:Uncharacterized protein n=1 Tax=Geosporobacter ferrireducens TaxID=1424294 RepID=A0A1D8GND5_9FIRM|nr:hypothetical protein [Geosporobacter ferrireducens]AOT72372.1 hypothetical protein Gferi_24175 [Geosporobacter ferrireducens]MTI56372.1 hypothetical protein [Geosporobacter ferrireducens]
MYKTMMVLGLLRMMKNRARTSKRKPVVFIPGLFGSMGDEIIPGTGAWNFGMASSVYEPFIKSIEELGYVRNKDLFIAFYDWRKDCNYISTHFLKKVIDHAKKVTRSDQVDVICHSMGGLAARAYAQGKAYENDIDNLIIIATPNAGAVDAYYFWSGGELPYEQNIFRTLMEGYLWILERVYGTENDMETIHRYLLGARDLLPGKKYNHYLYRIDQMGRMNFVPYASMQQQNAFIDALNEDEGILSRRGIKVTLLGAKGIETNQYLHVDRNYRDDIGRWADGKVLEAYKSVEGDGTVMLKSVLAIEGDTYIFHGSHTDMLKKCSFVLRKKLGVPEDVAFSEQEDRIERHLSILVEGSGDVMVKTLTNQGVHTVYSGMERRNGLYQQRFQSGLQWIMLTNHNPASYYIDFYAKESGAVSLLIMDSDGKTSRIKNKQVVAGKSYRVSI